MIRVPLSYCRLPSSYLCQVTTCTTTSTLSYWYRLFHMQYAHLWLCEETSILIARTVKGSWVLDHIDLNGLPGAMAIARRHERDLTAERPQIQKMILELLLTRVQHWAVLYTSRQSEIGQVDKPQTSIFDAYACYFVPVSTNMIFEAELVFSYISYERPKMKGQKNSEVQQICMPRLELHISATSLTRQCSQRHVHWSTKKVCTGQREQLQILILLFAIMPWTLARSGLADDLGPLYATGVSVPRKFEHCLCAQSIP